MNAQTMRKLADALEPFAKLAGFAHPDHRDTRPFIFAFDTAIAQRLTMGDLRRAAAALAALPPSQEDKIDPYKLGKEWCPDCKHDDGAHEPSCRYALPREPVAWRWRVFGAVNWVYDPSPEWREEHQDDDEIEFQPLYAALPAQGPLVPWELRCLKPPQACTAPECDCPLAEQAQTERGLLWIVEHGTNDDLVKARPDIIAALSGKPGAAQDQPGRLRQAIIDNTQGDAWWIGEILLSVLEKETGFGELKKPGADSNDTENKGK